MGTFRFYRDISDIPDSILLSSGQVIAEYDNEDNDLHMSLEVCGEVRVSYKGEIYRGVDEFPKELIERIKNDPNYWDIYAHSGEENDNEFGDIYVGNNNWFELFVSDSNGVFDSFLVDCENYTEKDIKEMFLEAEKEIQKGREAGHEMD